MQQRTTSQTIDPPVSVRNNTRRVASLDNPLLRSADAPTFAEVTGSSYTVKSGDTLKSVAEAHGITPEQLRLANPTAVKYYRKTDGSGVLAGFDINQQIIIPRAAVQEQQTASENESGKVNAATSADEATSVAEKNPEINAAPTTGTAPTPQAAQVEENLDTEEEITAEEVTTVKVEEAIEGTDNAESAGTAKPEKRSLLEEFETSGAGITASQDGTGLKGVEASEAMAKADLARMKDTVAVFKEVAAEFDIPASVLAAIASRESRGGKHLTDEGYGKSDSNGYGIMQVDVRHHSNASDGGANSKEHIRNAAQILADFRDIIKKKFPDWTAAQQLRGAIASYNFGSKNVQTWGGIDKGTTGDDYSSDVWARARYYEGLEDFGGDGTALKVSSSPSSAKKDSASTNKKVIKSGPYLTSSVGKSSKKYAPELINYVKDVRTVQAKLLELGLLSESDVNKELPVIAAELNTLESIGPVLLGDQKSAANEEKKDDSTSNVESSKPDQAKSEGATVDVTPNNNVTEDKLEATIAAIVKFQQKVMYGTADGRIDPNGGTIKNLMSATPDYVTKRLAGYDAHVDKLKREKEEAEAKKKAAAEKERKEAEKKAAAKKAEEAKIKALTEASSSESNIEKIYEQYGDDMRDLGREMRKYAPYNPSLVLGMFDHLSYLNAYKRDNLAFNIISNETNLAAYDKSLLERMAYELNDFSMSEEEKKQLKRVNEVIAGKGEKKEEVKKDVGGQKELDKQKAKNSAGSLKEFKIKGSVGKGGVNNISDVIIIQDFLIAFKYLDANTEEVTNVKKQNGSNGTISEDKLKLTIEAIKKFQKYGATKASNGGIWKGDGNIGVAGETAVTMKALMEAYNLVEDQSRLNQEMSVLTDAQWKSQFRWGANFKNGQDDQEKKYVEYVKSLTGLNDPADLHSASSEHIKKVKEKYGANKWFDNDELKTHAIKMNQKARKYKPNDVCCFDTSKLMLSFTGATEGGPSKKIQTFIEESSKGEFTNQSDLAIKYIDNQLKSGKAVMVGIDKGKVRSINETVTDHFIIITGKYKDNDKWYYYYMDPGTRWENKGNNKETNRLYIDGNKVAHGKNTLSQVRINE